MRTPSSIASSCAGCCVSRAWPPVAPRVALSVGRRHRRWLEAAGRRYAGSRWRGVMSSFEPLRQAWARPSKRGFGVPVFDWYGPAERVAALGTPEQGVQVVVERVDHCAAPMANSSSSGWQSESCARYDD